MNKQIKLLAKLAYADTSQACVSGYSLTEALYAGYSLSQARIAGYSLSQARIAGYSLSQACVAGYSLSQARIAGYSLKEIEKIEKSIPLVEKPYTKMHQSIVSKAIVHNQSTFGDGWHVDNGEHVCKSPMCTAGNLVAMGGKAGWALREKFGFATAAALIHFKAHPDYPLQNFDAIPQRFALAYIEEMAEREAAES